MCDGMVGRLLASHQRAGTSAACRDLTATSHLVVLLRLPTSSCTLYSDPGLSASASSIAGCHVVQLSAGFLVGGLQIIWTCKHLPPGT